MWPNPQETADLVTFTEEVLNGNLHFLCSDICVGRLYFSIFPDYFLLFFNRMTKQNDIFASFDTSLTMSNEASYNWFFSVLNTSDAITSSFYGKVHISTKTCIFWLPLLHWRGLKNILAMQFDSLSLQFSIQDLH